MLWLLEKYGNRDGDGHGGRGFMTVIKVAAGSINNNDNCGNSGSSGSDCKPILLRLG